MNFFSSCLPRMKRSHMHSIESITGNNFPVYWLADQFFSQVPRSIPVATFLILSYHRYLNYNFQFRYV